MLKIASGFGLSAVACCFSTLAAYAREEVSPLDPVTVYATRSPQKSFDVPGMVSTVDADAPGNALATDLDDLLGFVPGVEVDGGPRRTGQTLSIRGFDDNSIITLMDGRRQNFESAHSGRFYLDPSLLKSVEVVKGSSSSIYGGGAIGGVVAFETKNASDLLASGQTAGALASFAYSSASHEYAPIFTGYAQMGGWDVLGSAAYRQAGNIDQPDGNYLKSKDEILSGLAKIGYTLNDFHTFKVEYQTFNDDGQEPSNGSAEITSSNPLVDKKIRDHQVSFKYAYENPGQLLANPKLHLYYNYTDVQETNIDGSNEGRVQSRKLDTFGVVVDNQSKFVVNKDHRHTLSYGFEYYTDVQDGTSSTTGTRAGVPNAEDSNYGLYVQDEFFLSTALGELLFVPAARFDAYESRDDEDHSQNESKISPKFAVSYKPTKNYMIFSSIAQAFRAPNLTELYPMGQHFPGMPPMIPNNNFIPNPDLKPETVTTFEVGTGVSFDNVLLAKDIIQFKGSWFYSEGKDFISQNVDIQGGTTENINISKATIDGFELEGGYSSHLLNVMLGFSYVKAKDVDTGEYLSNNVPLNFLADVNTHIALIDGVLGWRARFVDRNDKVGSAEEPTAGYGLNDVYYRWQPRDHKNALDSLTLDVGVDNVFDQTYTPRFATVLGEGRSYVARVSYQW